MMLEKEKKRVETLLLHTTKLDFSNTRLLYYSVKKEKRLCELKYACFYTINQSFIKSSKKHKYKC